jgi:F-type H+-transporting ATPase subunit epsilon
MLLEIITPENNVLKDDIDELQVPTESGQIGIFPHHVNLITTLSPGELIIKKGGKEKVIAVTGGFLQVHKNVVSILADYATPADDIDVNQAIEAQKRAEAILKKGREQVNERDFAIAEAELRKSILKINVGTKRKRRNI